MKLLLLPKAIVTLLWLTIFWQNVGIGCSAGVANGTFNHPNFIIEFSGSPIPTPINDLEDLFPLIEKISSEFSQISCSDKQIPIAVATRNKILSTKHVPESVYKKPLQVYLQYTNKWEEGNGLTFVETLVELADKSNDVFPGTIKYLLAHHSYFGKVEFQNLWSFSETRKRFMDNDNCTHHTYKLGIVFPLDNCEKAILKVNSTLSDHVQMVAFVSQLIYKDMNNLTVEESFIQITTQFKLCTKTTKSINPKVEIAFQTGFSDTDLKGKQDFFALVTFWEIVNDWAISSNAKVFFFEAFDSPELGTFKGKRGLWKLAHTPKRYHIPADFIFMDKRLGNFFNTSETASSARNNFELSEDLDFKHDKFVVVFDSYTISKYGSDHYYHHNDFLPIIRTIADKFSSVCLLQQNPVESEAVAIYNNMTMQNKNKSNSHGLKQALRLYQLFSLREEHNLDYAINSANSVNSMYPGTVKYLMFSHFDTDKLLSYVTNAEENILNKTIGFAIYLPLLHCLRGTSVRTQVSRLLPYLNLFVISIGGNQEDHDVGVEKTVVGLTTAFTRCKKRIESMSQEQSLKFAFYLDWDDTDSHSVQNLSNLVSFWGQMNNWAKVTNTTVFMEAAFDDSNTHNYTNGWWRLAFDPHIYHQIAEYVYEDKTERQSKISNGIPYAASNTSLTKQNWKVTNSSFSRTNFIVQFSLIISNQYIMNDGDFHEDQIRKIILKLFTRFSSICTEAMNTIELIHKSMRHVPMTVAKFNRERGLKSASHSLYLFFAVDKNDDAFHVALEKAKIANSISEGSVEYLIALIKDDYIDDGRTKLNYYIKAKKLLSKASSTVLYKLGSIYSIGDCGHGTNPNKELIPLIKVLDLVIFYYYPEDRDYEAGVYESFRGLTKLFARCKQKISHLNLSIEVAFRTSWSDTTKYHGHTSENLVLFWEKMNKWAVATNTKVFMVEAFDSQYTKTIADSKLGWWRFLSEEIHNGSTEYIFEEKREVVLRNLAKDNPIHEPSLPRTALITVLTALLVFALTTLSVFLFVRHVSVRRYKNELEKAQQYILTKKEEIEFLEGKEANSELTGEKLDQELIAEAHLPKYDTEYEVEREHFKFDDTIPIGSGEFGIVYKGTVTKGEEDVDVAVKTLKKSNLSKAVKDLLVEIKVMIYLGKHENIVSVIGAHTEQMRRGNVFLFIELCEKGSLQNYLRELRRQNITSDTKEDETKVDQSINERRSDELDKIDLDQSIESVMFNPNSHEKKPSWENALQNVALDQSLLLRWSCEIANGMEFIASKKVVHADLATRNVLLTDNLTAKISDFGLSRRLFNYTSYVKTQTQPLPWKWMSPESLRRSEFTQKTDVWAFGITLWEIYSFGDAPYPGLSWSVNFPLRLEKGLRPQEPELNASSMYSVMLRCWNIDPKSRPTFLQLKEVLNRMT